MWVGSVGGELGGATGKEVSAPKRAERFFGGGRSHETEGEGLYVVVVGEGVCRPFLRVGREAAGTTLRFGFHWRFSYPGRPGERRLRDSKRPHTPGSALECTSCRQSGHLSFIIGLYLSTLAVQTTPCPWARGAWAVACERVAPKYHNHIPRFTAYVGRLCISCEQRQIRVASEVVSTILYRDVCPSLAMHKTRLQ